MSENDIIITALLSEKLGIKSINYLKNKYLKENNGEYKEPMGFNEYIDAYKVSKKYIKSILKKLDASKLEPTIGEFGSSLVLERLPTSIFSAHIMYQLGHKYEGHAISRLVVEQIAWAIEACNIIDLSEIEKISPTKSIGNMNKVTWLCTIFLFHKADSQDLRIS